jgi:hypothetical protein
MDQTAATATPTETAATPTEAPRLTTLEEREGAILADIQREVSEERAAARHDRATPPQPSGEPPVPEATPADAVAARKKRLDELWARGRANADKRRQQQVPNQYAHALEQAKREAAEAQARIERLVDPSTLNEESFIEFARRAKVSPEKIAEYVRESMANPEVFAANAAERAAAKAVEPELAKLRTQLDKSNETIQALVNQHRQAAAQAAEERATAEFFAFTEASAATAPYAANFLKRFGPQEFYKVALSSARVLPDGVDPQGILDAIEENLSGLAAMYSAVPPQQQAPQARPGAAKPNTISNAVAARRTSVVDEDDWAKLDLDARASRLINDLT